MTVRFFAAAQQAAGVDQLEVPAGPIHTVVARLTARLPPRFAQVLAISTLLSDGMRLDPQDRATLPPQAVVDVLPPFAGG